VSVEPYFPDRLDELEPSPFNESQNGASPRRQAIDGATFAFREAAEVPAVWGKDERVLWAKGEGLLIVGPDGVGKTTTQQQLLRARLGLANELLGLEVEPADKPVLYVAADRPRQAARSLRRMTSDEDRDVLAERLIVWEGPLPFDLTSDPRALADFALAHGVGSLFVDALKDVALDLTKDEVGSRVNLALQEVIAAGVEFCGLHHQRKEQSAAGKPKRLADVYGSRWLTAGMGSVVLLWGEPGDLVVELSHLKQPAEDVGPLKVVHDHVRGRSVIHGGLDLEQALATAAHGMTTKDGARALFESEKPTPNQVEKARRRFERLVERGHAERRDDPDGLARYFLRSQAS
jgi:replicative DNA helicase